MPKFKENSEVKKERLFTWQWLFFRSLFFIKNNRKWTSKEQSNLYQFLHGEIKGKEILPVWKEIEAYINQHPELKFSLYPSGSIDRENFRKSKISIRHNRTQIRVYIKCEGEEFPAISEEGAFSTYKDLASYQNWFNSQFKKNGELKYNIWKGAKVNIGRNANKYLYCKEIDSDGEPIRMLKSEFAKKVNTKSSNLCLYYGKPQGHKGYLISENKDDPIFSQPVDHDKVRKVRKYSKL